MGTYFGSTLAVASSSTRMRFPRSIARARQTSCLCPKEKLDPPSDTLKSNPGIAAFKSTLNMKAVQLLPDFFVLGA